MQQLPILVGPMTCPKTNTLVLDPVVSSSGNLYERSYLSKFTTVEKVFINLMATNYKFTEIYDGNKIVGEIIKHT